MYTLYGFYKYPPLIDNTLNIVNPLGELSDDSLTYAKDKSTHSNGAYPQTVLVGFHSVKDNVVTEIPSGIVTRILQLGQWIYNRASAGQIGTNPTDLLNALLGEFGDQVVNVQLGPLLLHEGIRLPRWIEFKDTKYDSDNTIKLWISDQAFNNEYPETNIKVIPPITNIDDMFLGEDIVRARLEEYSLSDRFDQVQKLRADYPYTLHRVENFRWINPVDASKTIVTPWIVVIYGRAGNNPDLIKEAIIDYIMANTEKDREDWEDLIPDLLLSTEFIITPQWQQYALPNLELEAGIHSPILRPYVALELAHRTTQGNGYSPEWIAEKIESSGLIYKSLAFTIIGNPNNRTGITQFSEQFSDYILVTNNSADFNRMSVRTQEFKDMLAAMVKHAETTNPTTQVPTGFSRITRKGVVYVGKQYEDILYLVVTKYSVEQLSTDMVEAD